MIRVKFFHIPAACPDEAEQALNVFLSQKRISHIEKQFVADGVNSFWSVCVNWLSREQADVKPNKAKVDYREVLSESEFACYAQLRSLRKELAEAHGVPPYALFNNEQLAFMVQHHVLTKADLSKVPGVGNARVEKYGDAFVALMTSLVTESSHGQAPLDNPSSTD